MEKINVRTRSKNLEKGFIPCIIYGKGVNIPAEINYKEFDSINKKYLTLTKAQLYTVVLDNKKEFECIIKEHQYHPVTDKIIHLDFFIASKDEIEIEVPIRISGRKDCIAIKEGAKVNFPKQKVVVKVAKKDLKSIQNGMDLAIDINVSQMSKGFVITFNECKKEWMKRKDNPIVASII